MRQRIGHIVCSFLLVFACFCYGLGDTLAGTFPCLPGCPACEPVPSCCQEVSSAQESGGHQAMDHSQKRSGCQHGGICLEGNPANDLLLSAGSPQHDGIVLSLLSASDPVPWAFPRSDFRFVPNLFPQKSPPLYLQNCSFLI